MGVSGWIDGIAKGARIFLQGARLWNWREGILGVRDFIIRRVVERGFRDGFMFLSSQLASNLGKRCA